jgi:hypothetical protein
VSAARDFYDDCVFSRCPPARQGCDGGRLYYDGCAMVLLNGECVAQGSQFSLKDCEVVLATVDLDDVRSYRGAIASRGRQAAAVKPAPRINVDFALCSPASAHLVPSEPLPVKYLRPEEVRENIIFFHVFSCIFVFLFRQCDYCTHPPSFPCLSSGNRAGAGLLAVSVCVVNYAESAGPDRRLFSSSAAGITCGAQALRVSCSPSLVALTLRLLAQWSA